MGHPGLLSADLAARGKTFPKEILLLIGESSDCPLSVLYLSLTCKYLWKALGDSVLARQARDIRLPRTYVSPRNIPSRHDIFKSQWWSLLLLLEDGRWRSCSRCFVLHGVDKFCEAGPATTAEDRFCSLGGHAGVVDCCPCFRMTFSKRRKLLKILEEENFQPGDAKLLILHECFGKSFDPDKGPDSTQPRPFQVLRHGSKLKGDDWLFEASFIDPELGIPRGPTYTCERGQIVGTQVSAMLSQNSELLIRTEYVHLSRAQYEGNGSSPLYNELFADPVLICPHRSLEQLLYDSFFAVFGLKSDLDFQCISSKDGDDIAAQLLHCPFCDTKVDILFAKRGRHEPLTFCKFTSVRNLGNCTDSPDSTWYNQTMFATESTSGRERDLRNPWRVWVRGTRPWARSFITPTTER